MKAERVEIDEPSPDHVTRFCYYGGIADGRISNMATLRENEISVIGHEAEMFSYTVTRYGVHADNETLCWVLLMHSPIAERGKL